MITNERAIVQRKPPKVQAGEVTYELHSLGLKAFQNQIDEWRLNYNRYDSNSDPEEYFYELKSTLKDYRNEFASSEDSLTQIDTALTHIDYIVEDLRSEWPEGPDNYDYHERDSLNSECHDFRSIFDDADL